MSVRFLRIHALFSVATLFLATTAMADPCGMVPPIYPGEQVPLVRSGEQKTYVFHKDGVETFVIRPGYTGKVEDFGMLIPFPNPPALRKVPDNVFGHIASAIDPPEVVVNLMPVMLAQSASANFANSNGIGGFGGGLALHRDHVRVLKEEAVGMYEVAVLEAGSAAALNKWMDQHGYKYPEGMDKVCEEYVEDKWCFVAVKTKVAPKSNMNPKPGQRDVDTALPAGASFDGHVQGMGFRFKTDELVVPMRLSAFNEGDLRNIVYLLTDTPKKIRSIPEEYVVRQISGADLYKNVTGPLPIRIIGGTEKDIPEYRRKSLATERDPEPKNGSAKELFASDLLAISAPELTLPHEEKEKELLRIAERFSLRGADIDRVNNEALKEQRQATVGKAIAELKKMTLTVIDGDFPREVIGSRNLTFGEYRMPAARNTPKQYDAKTMGVSLKKQPGVLKTGPLSDIRHDRPKADRAIVSKILTSIFGLLMIALGFVAVVFVAKRRK